MNRRSFLKITGLGTALTGFTGLGARIESLFAGKRASVSGDLLESWAISTCAGCEAGCGLRVRLVGGRVVGIRGNDESPVSRGGLCAKGFAGIQQFYNPDRIRGPLVKSQAGDGSEWRETSWDEALNAVSEKLAGGAGRVSTMLITGERNTLTAKLLADFVGDLDGGEVLYYPWGDSLMAHPAIHVSHGIDDPLVCDIENASYILSFSSDLLQTGPSQVNLSRAFGRFRTNPSQLRGTLVHFSPRLSITASKADEWIAIRPGTEGAVALAIAYTLLEEGLYDKRFIAESCDGFNDWVDENGTRQPGFRTTVLDGFSSQRVSEIAGVSPEAIIQAAREFAGSPRPVAVGSDRIDFSYQDTVTRLAIHSLNALVGNIDRKGGIVVPRKVPGAAAATAVKPESPDHRELPGGSEGHFRFPVSLYETDSTLDRLLAEGPPDVLFIHSTNPLFTSPRREDWETFIRGAGFVVSFSSFMDETSGMGHLVLPDSHYLEKWHERTTWTTSGYPVYCIGTPVAEPLHDTKSTGDVVLALAGKVFGEGAGMYPWSSFKEVIKERVRGIYEARRGDVFGPAFEETWVRLLERIGWRASSYPDFDTFWKKCVEKGGWWDPIYYYGRRERVYGNEQGRFDFGRGLVGNRARYVGSIKNLYTGDSWSPSKPDEAQGYPFLLEIHAHYPMLRASAGNEPFLMELMTFQGDQSGEWKMWVEMNPGDAGKMGLRNNDIVRIDTPKGRMSCVLKLFPGNPPGTLSLPFGLGHRSGGRYVEGRGANPADVVGFVFDQLTGIPSWGNARARIVRES